MEKIKGWFRELSKQIIIGAIIAMVITAGLGIWAWLIHFGVFYIAIFMLFALAMTTTILNQFDSFLERRKKPLAYQPFSYIGKTLADWLYKHGFSIQDEIQINTDFQFMTRDSQQRPIHIGKIKNRDEITIQSVIQFAEAETKMIGELSPENQNKLLSELRIAIARMGVQYVNVELPMKFIGIMCTLVLDDTFSRESFQEKIERVRNALVIIQETITPYLQGNPKGNPKTPLITSV